MLGMAMKAQLHQCGHCTWATPKPTETQQTSNEPLEASFLKEPSETDWDLASVPPFSLTPPVIRITSSLTAALTFGTAVYKSSRLLYILLLFPCICLYLHMCFITVRR